MPKEQLFASLVLLTVLAESLGASQKLLSCQGEDGLPVPWWLALKAPGKDIKGSTKYAYMDTYSKVVGGRYVWTEGTQIDGIADNPPANTLSPLYDAGQNDTTGYVIWNDEPAESHCKEGCPSFVLGHSKGVLGLSEAGGFWLSHSVPKYPDSPADSAFTGIHISQILNGQSFACVSLDREALDHVSLILQTADPYIYSPQTLPAGMATQFPNTDALLKTALGRYGPVLPHARIQTAQLQVSSGEGLLALAKSSTGRDGEAVRMWEDVVEPGLRSGMLVQTWPEGRDNDFPSYCGLPQSEYPSMTISNITIPEANLQWLTRAAWYRDHSKWAVAAEHVLPIFCAADNNRAYTQDFRGGTAICFTENLALHRAVAAIIAAVEPCAAQM